ncbi:MAG: esterase [Pseudomonadales bacterium]|nr:esterase [Pseudomonadales bacterium]
MSQKRANTKQNFQHPPLLSTLTEVPRTLLEISSLAVMMPSLASLPRGDGHPVLVLPGFMAGDGSTSMLRHYLSLMGYKALPWALGRNTGKPEILEHKLGKRFLEISEQYQSKVSLVGQSLGGVFAREIARSFPSEVRQVITLGSPISVEESGSVVSLVSRLFENQSGLSVDAMRKRLGVSHRVGAPSVPMTAIYSKRDGVVNWQACMELEEDIETQNIEVSGSHCGMAFNPRIYYIIRNRLSQAEGRWERYESPCLYHPTQSLRELV